MAGIQVLAWALVEVVAGIQVLAWALDLLVEVVTGIQVVAGLDMVARKLELTPSMQMDTSWVHIL